MQHTPLSYLNGDFIPFAELKLPVYDLGIVQGATVTERLRTFNHVPFLVDEHLSRLRGSLTAIGLSADLTDPLQAVIERLVAENSKSLAENEELVLVIFITAGQLVNDSNGLANASTPTVCAYTTLLNSAKYRMAYQHGVHLMTSSVRQLPTNSVSPQIKMRSRLHWYLADQEVQQRDPLAMAILLDQNGQLTETSSGNLFVVSEGKLYTPKKESTLLGISQEYLIKLAEEAGISVERTNLFPEDLKHCNEAFLTSSTYCILPVSRFNLNVIGNGPPGEITRRLTRVWENHIGCQFSK